MVNQMNGVVIPQVKKDLIADRAKLQEQSRDIAKAMWSGKLSMNEQKALNQICLLYGLDPILKQVVCLGGNIYITGGGLKVIANKNKETALNGIELTPATDEERRMARVPEESHYWKAIVWKKGCDHPFIEFGEACSTNVKLHQADWKALQDMSKTRAVNRALRNAYDIAFTSLEEMGYTEEQAPAIDTTATVEPEANGQPISDTEQPETAQQKFYCEECTLECSQDESLYSKRHYGRSLCRKCQAKVKR